ncbi:NAD-dependent deacetylase [Caballeronia sp. S22]|uniref:SIR2 family NAD-dependent protein deacylase n=1 Tax=Caballeronia sp. S22 TaxID=3137182 RepID=UPI0035305D63
MKTSKARLYVFSGAGLSAESGLSTFRTGDGIWTRNSVDEVCNIHTWRQNRPTVFKFYNERIREHDKATPNVAHKLLAQWQRRWGAERVRLLTQNVDDLLEKAGATSVVHLHGDLNSLLCTSCDLVLPKEGLYLDPTAACPICGNHDGVKPGVVFFGESAPAYRHLRRLSAEMQACDIFLCVGTAFEVVAPETMLPSNRWNIHPRNFLVDPSPTRREMCGVVEAHPATVGLQNLQDEITSLME